MSTLIPSRLSMALASAATVIGMGSNGKVESITRFYQHLATGVFPANCRQMNSSRWRAIQKMM
jgi:hypothetical protein